MRTVTMLPPAPAHNQSSGLPPAAEAWAEGLASTGLPQRYILRLYVYVRMASGGVAFESLSAELLRAGMLFDITGPIVGKFAADAGDTLVIAPTHPTRQAVLLKKIDGETKPVTLISELLPMLPELERCGAIRFRRCFMATKAGEPV